MSRRPLVWTLPLLIAIPFLSSCSPKKFSADASNNVGQESPGNNGSGNNGGGGNGNGSGNGGNNGGTGAITCNPSINGGSTSVTLTPSSSNPTINANCSPSSVDYTWTVTRNGTPVTINGLNGATSTPDFLTAGPGTYLITLDANAVGWSGYHLGTPLQVVVQGGGGGSGGTITCNPKLNGSSTSVTVTASSQNPTVSANCSPSSVSYVWTVQRGGSPVTVGGLSGSSAVGDFWSAGAGTYQIYLSATQTGYTGYTQSSPLTVTVNPPSTGTPHSDTHNITVSNNKLDVLLIIDDSSSMLADNTRLATRLEGFVNSLSAEGFDWQMCVTLTRAQRISSSDPQYYWGASTNWAGNPSSPGWILKSGTSNAYQIFYNTIVNNIGAGWAGTNDERAIKGAYWHLYNGDPNYPGNSGCYRNGAGLAVIILSDEDERSVGGDASQIVYEEEKNKPLENDDLPSTYVAAVKQVFGNSKRFTVNSIIVRPGDTACKNQQDQESSKSHYGVKYNELSNLTGGRVGSICDSDYSTNLNYFVDTIVRSQASLPLQCSNAIDIVELLTPNYTHTSHVSGSSLVFTPSIPAGTTVKLNYTCP